jgi:hypothetical protein
VDIDPEMVRAYMDELEVENQNTTPSPKLRRWQLHFGIIV